MRNEEGQVLSRSARWRAAAGYALLIAVPGLLAVAVLTRRFAELGSFAALDAAQVARNLSEAHGFTTLLIRPLSLLFHPSGPGGRYPDLYHAPLYPLLLGLWDCLHAPTDRWAAALGVGLWLVSVWLTFWVARRWFGTASAVIATALYVTSLGPLLVSAGGAASALVGVGVLLIAWLLVPDVTETEAEPIRKRREGAKRPRLAASQLWRGAPERLEPELPRRSLLLIGALCGLTALTAYPMVVLGVGVAARLGLTQRRRWRAVGLFAAAFAAIVVLWMRRNLLLAGSPFFSLYWYEALANTASFPGDSVWRGLTTRPPHPLLFVVTHLGEILGKIQKEAGSFAVQAVVTVGLAPALLSLVGLVANIGSRRWRRLMRGGAGCALACAGITLALRPDAAIVAAWAPLASIIGGALLHRWLSTNLRRAINNALSTPVLDSRISRRAVVAAGGTLILVVVSLPLARFVVNGPPGVGGVSESRLVPLRRSVPPTATVVTDAPAMVAWYAGRRAVWLCLRESDWDAMVRGVGSVDAAFMTPALGVLAEKDAADSWEWLRSREGVYRDLAPPRQMPVGALLRLRVNADDPAVRASAERIRRLRAVVSGDPRSAAARISLADAYLKADRLSEADQEYRLALARDPRSVPACVGVSVIAGRMGHKEEAVAFARRAYERGRADADVAARLAEALIVNGDADEAADVYRSAVAAHPRNRDLLMGAARCQAGRSRWREAEGYAERAVRIDTRAVAPRVLRAQIAVSQGQTDQAVDRLTALTREHPDDSGLRLMLGKALLGGRRYAQALSAFAAVRRLDPGSPDSHVGDGSVYLAMGATDRAAASLDKALALAPDSRMALMPRAAVYVSQGKPEVATRIYQRLLLDHPGDLAALNNLVYLQAGQLGKIGAAITAVQEILAEQPYEGRFHDTLGWLCHLAGRRREAVAHLKDAAQLAPGEGSIRYHLGKVLVEYGSRVEGERHLRAALACRLLPEERRDVERLLTHPRKPRRRA